MTRVYITKQTRKAAVEACALLASAPDMSYSFNDVDVDEHSREAQLCRQAFWAVPDCHRDSSGNVCWRAMWAEAGALIESGWRTGDPVEMLPVNATQESVDAILKECYPTESVEQMAAHTSVDFSRIERHVEEDEPIADSGEFAQSTPEEIADIHAEADADGDRHEPYVVNGHRHESIPDGTPSEDALDQETVPLPDEEDVS